MSQEVCFCLVGLEAGKDTPEIWSAISGILDSEPILEEDMFAFSNFEHMNISPSTWKAKNGRTMHGYFYRIALRQYEAFEPLRESIEALSALKPYLQLFRVTATDVKVDFRIIQKVSKERQKELGDPFRYGDLA